MHSNDCTVATYNLAQVPVDMLAPTIDKHVNARLPCCGKRNGLPQPDVHGIVLAVVRQFPILSLLHSIVVFVENEDPHHDDTPGSLVNPVTLQSLPHLSHANSSQWRSLYHDARAHLACNNKRRSLREQRRSIPTIGRK